MNGSTDAGVAIAAKNLVFRYRTGKTLFSGLTFSVGPGDVMCIVGPPMSGKTTMCRLIGGYHRPTGGELIVKGEVSVAVGLSLGPGDFTTLREFARYKALEFNVPDMEPRETLRICRLESMGDLQVRQVGSAIKQRVALAVLLHRGCRIVVLDAGPEGRDPETSRIVRPLTERFLATGGILVYTGRKPPVGRAANTVVRIVS